MQAGTMAKKKTESRDQLVAVRCGKAWKNWLEAMAKAERVTPTQIIDKSLAEFAANHGYKTPPDR